MKKAFTLAEVLITLVTIGIISAIVIPVAVNTKPDEKIMKFKKAHNTLYKTIGTLINSDKFYKDGDMGIKPNGNYVSRNTFCNNMADVLNAKKVVCEYTTNLTGAQAGICGIQAEGCVVNIDYKAWFDTKCKEAVTNNPNDMGIKTADGVSFFEATLDNNFGCLYNDTCEIHVARQDFNGVRLYNAEGTDIVNFSTGIKTNRNYKAFCIDVDEINGGEDPFGYGIRVDGKIMTGKRADEWLKKYFQKDE